MNWQVYILYSAKLNRFYIGCTRQFEIRLSQHLQHTFGETSFTAKANDWQIHLVLGCRDELHAKAVEKHIKKMKSKRFIENLLRYPEMQQRVLSKF